MKFEEKMRQFYHLSEEQMKMLVAPVCLDDLPSYHRFKQMDQVLVRIEKAIQKKEKIFIYGDYDADGILATSILVRAFHKRGIQVGYYIPSRYQDGYGLQTSKVQLAHEKGYQLIITVDNGVSQKDAIKEAKRLGMDVIVTDHHTMPNFLVDADYILHPIYSHYGDVYCCGAYVAFMISWGILGSADPYLLCLAGIATLSDMMELVSYNRNIVRLTLSYLKENDYDSIRFLIGDEPIDETIIGMKLTPKINAVGRMIESNHINRMVRYFTSEDKEEQVKLAKWIDNINQIRKDYTKVAMEKMEIDDSKAAIMLICEEKEGLIGLFANRLLQTYQKPVIVFSKSQEDHIYKASARAKNGFSIVKAFQALSNDLLVYGGHALAGGCSLEESHLPHFLEQFELLAQQHPFIPEEKEKIELTLDEVTMAHYEIYRQFGPFGTGWPAPTFSIRHLQVSSLHFIHQGEHLMTQLSMKTRLVGFHITKESLQPYGKIRVDGTWNLNHYQGETTLQFLVETASHDEEETILE